MRACCASRRWCPSLISVRRTCLTFEPTICDLKRAFLPNAADQSFGIWILPRRSHRRDNFFDSHSGYTTAKILSVYLIAISDKESWCSVLRGSLR